MSAFIFGLSFALFFALIAMFMGSKGTLTWLQYIGLHIGISLGVGLLLQIGVWISS